MKDLSRSPSVNVHQFSKTWCSKIIVYFTLQICCRTSRQNPKQHILCLLSEVDPENNTSKRPTMPLHSPKKRSRKTINLRYSLLVSLPRTMIVIYRLCTGLTTVKEGFQSQHDTCYSCSSILIQCGSWKIRKIFWKASIQDYQNTLILKLMVCQLFILLFPILSWNPDSQTFIHIVVTPNKTAHLYTNM